MVSNTKEKRKRPSKGKTKVGTRSSWLFHLSHCLRSPPSPSLRASISCFLVAHIESSIVVHLHQSKMSLFDFRYNNMMTSSIPELTDSSQSSMDYDPEDAQLDTFCPITGRPPIPLYLSWDYGSLSPYQAELRKNIEFFEGKIVDRQSIWENQSINPS